MQTPAFAITWQLWTRHRWGIATALATFAAMLAISPLLPMVTRMIASSIVLAVVIAYFMNILLFTDSVGSLESGYPRRMYALPVPSRTLAGWPMLYGGAVVALLWVAGACLVYRPSGFQAPVFLPALGLAAAFVWLQAFAWSPIRNPVIRILLPVCLIQLLVALPVSMVCLRGWVRFDEAITREFPTWFPFVALLRGITQPVVLGLLVTYVAGAYAMARAGIASDRRGDTWRVVPQGITHALLALRPAQSRRPFRSSAEAQLWYEWECHGLVIPVTYGVLLLLMCGVTILRPGGDFALQLTLFLIIPVAYSGVLSFSLGRPRPFWVKSRAFITFLATRPMSSGSMVAAKLRMTALSLLLMFAIMLLELAIWVIARGYTAEAVELGRRFLTALPGWKAPVVLLLGAVTVPAFTWGLATAGFPVVLAGRSGLHLVLNLAAIAGGMGFSAAVIGLIQHPAYLARLIAALPWLVLAAAVVKVIVASVAFRACLRLGLMRTRSMIVLVAAALALAACAIVLAVLLSAAKLLPVLTSVVLLGIVMLVPLGRLALAPLALEWNRHR